MIVRKIIATDGITAGESGPKGVVTLGSLTAIVCANGASFAYIICIKHIPPVDVTLDVEFDIHPPDDETLQKLGVDLDQVIWTSSPTGYIDTDILVNLADEIGALWETWTTKYDDLTSDSKMYLVLDNLGAHRALDVQRAFYLENNINMVFLPPNTTQWSQPLDRYVFAQLKSHLGTGVIISDFDASARGENLSGTKLFWDNFWSSMCVAFAPECVKASFKSAHMWPWTADGFTEFFTKHAKANKPKDPDAKIHVATTELVQVLVNSISRKEQKVVKVRQKRGKPMTSRDILEQQKIDLETREAEEKDKAARTAATALEKQRQQEARLCRNMGCLYGKRNGVQGRMVHSKTSSKWYQCLACESFRVCRKCRDSSDMKKAIEEHEAVCGVSGVFPAIQAILPPSNASSLDENSELILNTEDDDGATRSTDDIQDMLDSIMEQNRSQTEPFFEIS